MASALAIVQNYFPQVKRVSDSKRRSFIEVTKRDNNSAKVKNHQACAMAVACKRKEKADGVIVAMKTAYIVKGNRAIRFSLPENVSREIVSFDRGGGVLHGNV